MIIISSSSSKDTVHRLFGCVHAGLVLPCEVTLCPQAAQGVVKSAPASGVHEHLLPGGQRPLEGTAHTAEAVPQQQCTEAARLPQAES